jgi:hypothetical protein
MNILLHSLIEELKELWQAIDAHDSHMKCHFILRVVYGQSMIIWHMTNLSIGVSMVG